MSTPTYLRVHHRQANFINAVLSTAPHLSHGEVPKAKQEFYRFIENNPILHLEARLAIARVLIASPASNKFWTKVIRGVLDDCRERGVFRRQILTTSGRLGEETDSARSTISRSLASPKPRRNRLTPAINVHTPGKPVRLVTNPTLEADIWARLYAA